MGLISRISAMAHMRLREIASLLQLDKSEKKELFDVLRELDDIGAKKVFARCPNKDGVGLAVYNRLLRAAGFQVVKL
mgnify:CR=1 FL=1